MTVLEVEKTEDIDHLDFNPECQLKGCHNMGTHTAEVFPKHNCRADQWMKVVCDDCMEDWHECRWCEKGAMIKYVDV